MPASVTCLALLLAVAVSVPGTAAVIVADVNSLTEALGVQGVDLVELHEGDYALHAPLSVPAGATLRPRAGHTVTLRLLPSVPHPVLALHDVDNATVAGVHVVGHDGTEPLQRAMALEVIGGTGNTVDSVVVVGGLKVASGTQHLVTRSDISNPYGVAGGICVYIAAAGDPMTLAPSGHAISHSEVHDCRGLGNPWPSSAYPCKSPCPHDPDPNATGTGVLLSAVTGATVNNNFIHDTNYHGVFVESRLNAAYNHSWPGSGPQVPSALNTIELNHIKDWSQCQKSVSTKAYPCDTGADGGCVYFFTYIWGHGQRVVNNFCHMSRPDLWGGKGLYLDGSSSGIETRGNIIWNVSGVVIDNNDGHDNHHFGNIAMECSQMGSLSTSNWWGKGYGGACTSHAGEHGHAPDPSMALVASYLNSATWRKRFPEIQTWFNRTTWAGPEGTVSCDPMDQGADCCMFPAGTVANYSVMVNLPSGTHCGPQHDAAHCRWHNISGEFCPPQLGPSCWPDKARFQRVGQQKMYTDDPGFVDIANGDFTLKPDAKLFVDFPGFPVIPFREIGPQKGVWTGSRRG